MPLNLPTQAKVWKCRLICVIKDNSRWMLFLLPIVALIAVIAWKIFPLFRISSKDGSANTSTNPPASSDTPQPAPTSTDNITPNNIGRSNLSTVSNPSPSSAVIKGNETRLTFQQIEQIKILIDQELTPSISNYQPGLDRYNNVCQPERGMVSVLDDNNTPIYFNGALFEDSSAGALIMTQAPLPTTMDHMQRMVLQHKVKLIVNLTNSEDLRRCKCHDYWNEWDTEMSQSHLREGVVLKKAPEVWNQSLYIHFTQWPDRGVPDMDVFMKFLFWLREQQKGLKEGEKTVMHCSAGIGRTGVLAVGLIMLAHIERGEERIDLAGIIQLLRSYRPGMVQTTEQLEFCFEVAHRLMGHEPLKKLS